MVVVLPAPLGPRKPKMVPGAIVSERSCTAWTSPKLLLKPSSTITGWFISNPYCDDPQNLQPSVTGRHLPSLMKFKTVDPSRRLFTSASILLLLLFGSSTITRADAVSELASFSIVDKVDRAHLAKSAVKTDKGPPMSNPRFLGVQSCYVAPGAPAQLAAALR